MDQARTHNRVCNLVMIQCLGNEPCKNWDQTSKFEIEVRYNPITPDSSEDFSFQTTKRNTINAFINRFVLSEKKVTTANQQQFMYHFNTRYQQL